jgi:hypothetical protein
MARWYAAWTAAAADNVTDAIIVDVSGLAPVPAGNSVKVKRVDILMSGNFQATLEFDNVRSGTVDTATASTQITWVSGDKFDTTWTTGNFGGITAGSTEYAITSVDSATAITAASDPGDQTGVAYSQDGTIDRFIGQADESNIFARDYSDGPSGGITPYKDSANLVGDITLTTAGVADGDELNVQIIFERT